MKNSQCCPKPFSYLACCFHLQTAQARAPITVLFWPWNAGRQSPTYPCKDLQTIRQCCEAIPPITTAERTPTPWRRQDTLNSMQLAPRWPLQPDWGSPRQQQPGAGWANARQPKNCQKQLNADAAPRIALRQARARRRTRGLNNAALRLLFRWKRALGLLVTNVLEVTRPRTPAGKPPDCNRGSDARSIAGLRVCN